MNNLAKIHQAVKILFYITLVSTVLAFFGVVISKTSFAMNYHYQIVSLFGWLFGIFLISSLLKVISDYFQKDKNKVDLSSREHIKEKRKNIAALVLLSGVMITVILTWLILHNEHPGDAAGDVIIFVIAPAILGPAFLISLFIYLMS